MKKSILIVGSGALATLFAYKFANAGIEVTMLGTWTEGLNALRTAGARIEGRDGQKIRTSDNSADCDNFQYAIVLVKSWQTERAARQLSKCLALDGLALTLQNGLGNDTILKEVLGKERVTRGVTTLGATLLAPGVITTNGYGEVKIEEQSRLKGLEDLLRIADFEAVILKDAEPIIWGKLMVNAAINPLAALLKLKNGELLDNQPARLLMGELAREVASVSQGIGIALPPIPPEKAVEEVALQTSGNTASMLQDVLRGAPTEIDAINGAVVRVGEKVGILTPTNRVVWSLVKALTVHDKIPPFPTTGGA